MGNNAKWLVIEGLDGAGKTSAMKVLHDFLIDQGQPYHHFREPGGTALGEGIRTLFKTEGMNIVPMTEVLLMYAARIQLMEQAILPALAEGYFVTLDRHELSTFAYQVGGRGVDYQTVKEVSKLCMPARKPDLTIYLDVKPEIGLARAKDRGDLDAIESQSLEYFQAIAQAYARELRTYPGLVIIDANRSIQAVQKDIRHALEQLMRETM